MADWRWVKSQRWASMDSGMLSNFPYGKHELHVAVLEQNTFIRYCLQDRQFSFQLLERSNPSALQSPPCPLEYINEEECTKEDITASTIASWKATPKIL